MPSAFGAPARTIDPPCSDSLPQLAAVSGLNLRAGIEPSTLASADLAADTEPKLGGILEGVPVKGWFDSCELEFSAADENSTALTEAGGCVYPDSYLRSLGGGPDECGVLTPDGDKSAILTLPFLAVSGWVLAICGVAGLRRSYGNWRTRRWVRQLRAQGLAPRMAAPGRFPQRRAQRSRSHSRSRPRRYVG